MATKTRPLTSVSISTPNRLNDRNPSESQVSLQLALRTLCAIRQRYEVGHRAHPDARFYRVDVVVEGGDLAWITATIKALEKAIAAVASDVATPAAQTHPESVNKPTTPPAVSCKRQDGEAFLSEGPGLGRGRSA